MAIELNREQEEVVKYTGKLLSVEAGPGAGKTRVIIERVKFLLNELKVDPSTLLIITFTKKAAQELKERLAEDNISKSDIQKMQISTIHSFCTRILEENGAVGFDIIADDLSEKVNMFLGKYLEELGFVNEYYLPQSQIKDIIRKYDEYCTFKVDTDELVKYISNTRPIDPEYVEFVNEYMEKNDGAFPRQEVRDNEIYKKSWYNAKYLQIAKSYPIYLDILKRENVTDFGQMQVKTLEILENGFVTPYKNILIDEFQDTDPVQMAIFEKLIEYADSFTVVGDINQSIYGFRGSNENYFDYLAETYGDELEIKSLQTNYRSTEEIIDISEDYIKHQRSKNSKLGKAVCGRDEHNDVYYLLNDNNKDEANNIFNIIKSLKEDGKIRRYSEIGILTRTVKGSSSCIDSLIGLLEDDNIPYQIKGRNDLLEKDEIKSVLTLLFHLVQDDDPHSHIMNSWQKDWLNLRAYTGEEFNQILFNLSDDTKRILNNIQSKFEQDIMDVEKIVYEDFTGKKSKLRSFSGVFNRPDEILKEIFQRIERPILTDENIEKWGITDKDDLEFFYKLNALKYLIYDENIKYFDKPTVLNIFMILLTDITGFLNQDTVNANDGIVENLANVSNTLYNYEDVRYSRDLRGVFWFIYRNIEGHESFIDENDGVQIMTVHKSKGLEFPVVILASMSQDKFPLKFKEQNPENGYINGSPVYYTPIDCLEYRNFESMEEEAEAHNWEEERVIYVAMTRAEDTLILSSIVPGSQDMLKQILENEDDHDLVKSISKGPGSLQKVIDSNLDYTRLINPDDIDINVLERKYSNEPEMELITLSYTALENYLQCPFKYQLANKIGFKTSEKKQITDGIFIHRALEIINKKIIANNNEYLGNEEVSKIVSTLFNKSNVELENENEEKYLAKLEKITKDVIYYYEEYGNDLEILEAEYPFSIKNINYSFGGIIDLIYKTDNGNLGIIDYKNTAIEEKFIEKYTKQLNMYVLALKDKNQKYESMEVEELKIYAIKSKKMIDIRLSEAEIEKAHEDLSYVAEYIKNDKYPAIQGDYCTDCPYGKICGKKED